MKYQPGEVYCIQKSEKQKKYVLIVNTTQTSWILIHIIYAKPFEHDSSLFLGSLSLSNMSKKEHSVNKSTKFRISSTPFSKIDLTAYGNPVGMLNKKCLKRVQFLIYDKDAVKTELQHLKDLKNGFHKRLTELKKTKELNRYNNANYSAIEKEMDEISMNLGYELINHGTKSRQYREAPSKSIKIYLGGDVRGNRR